MGAIITSLGKLGYQAAVPVLKQALRFFGENRSQLLEEQRQAYQNLHIEENILGTIEHLTGKPVDPQDIKSCAWRYAEINSGVSLREKSLLTLASSHLTTDEMG